MSHSYSEKSPGTKRGMKPEAEKKNVNADNATPTTPAKGPDDVANLLAHDLAPLRRALGEVAKTLRTGRLKHPDDDGFRASAEFHLERFDLHLRAIERDDCSEDHLLHGLTRLLMAFERSFDEGGPR